MAMSVGTAARMTVLRRMRRAVVRAAGVPLRVVPRGMVPLLVMSLRAAGVPMVARAVVMVAAAPATAVVAVPVVAVAIVAMMAIPAVVPVTAVMPVVTAGLMPAVPP